MPPLHDGDGSSILSLRTKEGFSMWKEIKYWLDTHTMNPLAWPYVLFESAHHKLEDAIIAQKQLEDAITKKDNACPFCGSEDFTESGLCEKCGNFFRSTYYGP